MASTHLFRSIVKEKISQACEFLKEQEHTNSLPFALDTQKTVLSLIGVETESLTQDEASRASESRTPSRHLMYS